MNTADNTFTLTLYDDTAIEVESILYATLVKTSDSIREELEDIESTVDNNTSENTNNTNGDASESTNNNNIDNTSEFTPIESVTVTDSDMEEGSSETGSGNQQDLLISDKINNINISYGWVDRNGNVVSEKKVNANFTKYSVEFEGASVILTTEGTSLDNTLLSSPSENVIKEYPADKWNGVASDIVKDIVDSTEGYTYKKGDIEETEPILGEDGKPKSFIRNGETASVFIKKYLCEEAKSKKSGKVGYDFIVDKGRVTFKPSNLSDKGVNVSGTVQKKKNFSETGELEVLTDENSLGAGLDYTSDSYSRTEFKQSNVVKYAKMFAYEYGVDSSIFSTGNGSPKKEYQEALDREFPNRYEWDIYDSIGASSSVFVATVIRSSGVDKKFPYKFFKQKARLRISGIWVDIEYRGNEKLLSGDIVTYKRIKTGARFIGIYIEEDGNRYIACAMNGMAYGCLLGGEKVDEILDTSDKSINIFREVRFADKAYTYDVDYEEDING